jgi:hypothetical protein
MRIAALVVFCALPACQPAASRYDAAAGAAYRAAWEKRRAGDEAGYKSALAALAARRGTWAADRAALDLELLDEGEVRSRWYQRLEQAVQVLMRGRGTKTAVAGPAAVVQPDEPASPSGEAPPQTP